MTDPQLMTLAIAIVVPLSLLLYSNSRITDAKETLRAEMALGFQRLDHRMELMEARLERMEARFERIEARFEQMEARFDLVMSKLVDIDNRLSKVEDKLNL